MSIYNNDTEYQKFIAELPEPNLSKNCLTVLENRYLRRDKDNKPCETPKELFARVAWAISSPELNFRTSAERHQMAVDLYMAMIEGRIMFNSPTLFNAGTGSGLGLSACYVRVPEDSLDSIMEVCRDLALIQKAGGGVGYNFSKLRPKGSMVSTCAATTDGPLPFIDMYCSTTNAIQQGAKRRGAQMGMLAITHPDVWQFIEAKGDLTRWQNMNVSLLVTNDWMYELKSKPKSYHKVSHPKWGEGYLVKDCGSGQYHPVKWDGPVEELEKGQQSVDLILTKEQLFYKICERAWTTGEPGLAFVDRINEDWMFSSSGINPIEATNPCGEQPLENGGNCTLASINLAKYYCSKNEFDEEALRKDVRLMQHALDNVVEINTFPVDIVTKQNKKTRRIGGGIMGWADLLFLCGIPYDSKRARELASIIMGVISDESERISYRLALERGSFGDHASSDFNIPMRNAYMNTIAPTGTISIIADCSGGIEPIFSLAFTREVLQGANGRRVKMFEGNKIFETKLRAWLDSKCTGDGKNLIEDFVKEIIKHAATNGTLKNYMGVPALWEGWKEFIAPFVTTKDISMEGHVLMQAEWQKYVDTAISKTINLNNDATVDDVIRAYKLAFEKRCKGITVYRDGSRDGVAGMVQPMKLDKSDEKPKEEAEAKPTFHDIKWESPSKIAPAASKSEVFNALKIKQVTPMGNLHVTCVLDESNLPVEIFAQISKAGEQPAADLEAMCRLASMYLRESKNFDEVIKQLEHIGSSTLMPSKDGQIKSLPDGLSLALKKIKKVLSNDSTKKIDTTKVTAEKIHIPSNKNDQLYSEVCPVCSKKLIRAEGCLKCDPSCGFSKC